MGMEKNAGNIEKCKFCGQYHEKQIMGKLSITRAYKIESAHFLPYVPDGHKCKNVHGHTYRVEVTFNGSSPIPLDQRGFIKDFAEIDGEVLPLLKFLDHRLINDQIHNPTAEMIATWIAAGVSGCSRVRVYENDDCWADWRVE